MRMPRLNEIPKSRKTIDTFGGYNHSNSVAEYEFYDTTNMSTREYPSLAPRKPRGTPMDPDYEPGSSPTDGKFHSPRALTRVDDNVAFLQYDRTEPAWYVRTLDQVYGPISDEHGLSSVDRIITNGAYIVGWQNGHSDTLRYVNTADSTDRGAVNAEWVQGANDDIDIDPCDAEGNVISVTTMATAPANPSNGDYWIDSSVSGNERTLQRYSVSQQSWVIVPAIYIKLSCPDIAENFSAGDVVQITNKDRLEGYPASIIRGYHLIEKAYHNENNTAQDYIVIIGQAATGGTTWPAPGAPGTEVYLYRTAPNMDYIIENGNRLWGCRYGENLKGEFVNEIYASGGQLPLVTLIINNSETGTLRYVLDNQPRQISGQEYEASAFTVQLPERSESGFTDLSFSVCGVNGDCYRYVRQALASHATTYITLQHRHPESPADVLYELTLTVTGGQITREAATFTASFCDMLNVEFPRLRYTAHNAPGLKYVA